MSEEMLSVLTVLCIFLLPIVVVATVVERRDVRKARCKKSDANCTPGKVNTEGTIGRGIEDIRDTVLGVRPSVAMLSRDEQEAMIDALRRSRGLLYLPDGSGTTQQLVEVKHPDHLCRKYAGASVRFIGINRRGSEKGGVSPSDEVLFGITSQHLWYDDLETVRQQS